MMNPKSFITPRAALARVIARVIVGGALVLASAPAFASPIGWDAFAGWYTDPREFQAGEGARISLGTITFNPNGEYIFAENGKKYTLNLDGTMSVMPLGVASVYAGAGVTWFTVDPDNGKSSTDTGLNLIGGAGLNAIPLKPYGQIKWAFINGDQPFSFSFGVRF